MVCPCHIFYKKYKLIHIIFIIIDLLPVDFDLLRHDCHYHRHHRHHRHYLHHHRHHLHPGHHRHHRHLPIV